MKNIFVTGIGTEIGKTVVASILTEAYEADYWKPIQAGELEVTDTLKVKQLISNKKSTLHPEAFLLKRALSPHQAASLEDITIALDDLKIPVTNNKLIIEGAGGLMVPFNYAGDTFLDFVKHNNLSVVVVISFYLGSINHSLLTLEVLKNQGINVLGVIFNGVQNEASKNIILTKTGVVNLFEVNDLNSVSCDSVKQISTQLKGQIPDW